MATTHGLVFEIHVSQRPTFCIFDNEAFANARAREGDGVRQAQSPVHLIWAGSILIVGYSAVRLISPDYGGLSPCGRFELPSPMNPGKRKPARANLTGLLSRPQSAVYFLPEPGQLWRELWADLWMPEF